jgi:DNA-directed RNA polymerase omega subunit
MKFCSRTDVMKKIPNKYDAVMAISLRVKMLVEGKKRLIEQNDENPIKVAMEEIASGALEVEVEKAGK